MTLVSMAINKIVNTMNWPNGMERMEVEVSPCAIVTVVPQDLVFRIRDLEAEIHRMSAARTTAIRALKGLPLERLP